MSEFQCAHMLERLKRQAEAERECGLADMTPHFHIMWTLVNKGECFAKCIEFDPEWVQGGAMIEQLNDELLGPGPLRLLVRLQRRPPRGSYPAEPASGLGRHPPDPDTPCADPRQHGVHHAGRERGERRHAW